jgi:hypothetical protein
MRIRSARFLALAVAIGLAVPLLAQRPGGRGFGGGIDAGMLLGQKSVQEELKMSEDQITKVDKLNKDLRDKYANDLKDKDKRAETMKKMTEERNKALADTLKPEQTKRLKQIEIQLGGLNALAKEEVQTALKLSDKQKADIKSRVDDLAKDSQELFKDAGKDFSKFAEIRTKVQTLSKEAAAKFVSTLSDEQKSEYKKLAGDEFKGKIEFTPMRRPGKDKQ